MEPDSITPPDAEREGLREVSFGQPGYAAVVSDVGRRGLEGSVGARVAQRVTNFRTPHRRVGPG